jgi:hypothetical protein
MSVTGITETTQYLAMRIGGNPDTSCSKTHLPSAIGGLLKKATASMKTNGKDNPFN